MSCDSCTGGCACAPSGGDPGWHVVHRELAALHVEKASGYGTDEEPLANYVETSQAVGEPDEFTPWLRIYEKAGRALNLIRAGRADENKEGVDVAALAIGAEALRRRRSVPPRPAVCYGAHDDRVAEPQHNG